MSRNPSPNPSGRKRLSGSRTAVALVAVVGALTAATIPSAAADTPIATGPEAAAVYAAAAAEGVPLPQDDPFYAAPAGFAATAPGTILRSRSVSVTSYGLPITLAENAYQLLIRTTNSVGTPVVAVSTVFVPKFPSFIGPRPLMSFQIAIDSLGSECSPSLEMRLGLEKEATGEFVGLSAGWDTVITDYEGTQMSMFAGPMAGHAVLDGIRAAEHFQASGLNANTRVVAWGYSGGGQATAWAAQLASTYAPELKMAGYIAGDLPVNLGTVLNDNNKGIAAGFVIGGALGLMRDYPALESELNAAGLAKQQQLADQCQLDLVATNAFQDVNSYATSGDILGDPQAQAVIRANSLGSSGNYTSAPTAPVLLQQSTLDELISASNGEDLDRTWCAAGGTVQFDLNAIPEHVIGDLVDIPESLAWAEARFLGLPAGSNC